MLTPTEWLDQKINNLYDTVNLIRKSLNELRQAIKEHNNEIRNRLEHLEQLEKIEDMERQIYSNKKPHKCPVCEGEGKKKIKYLSDGRPLIVIDCISCEGKGIVWG